MSHGFLEGLTVDGVVTAVLGLRHEVAAVVAMRAVDVTSSFVVTGGLLADGVLDGF